MQRKEEQDRELKFSTIKRVIQEKRSLSSEHIGMRNFLDRREFPTLYKAMVFTLLYPGSRSMKSVVQIMEKEAGLILGKQLSGNFRKRHAVCICQKWSIYLKT